MREHFEELKFNPANHVPLSPVSFLKRASAVYCDHPAWTYGDEQCTWRDMALRCRSVAGALVTRGIKPGDTVSVISPNIPQLFELHYAVPMSGAVLNTINTRLEKETVAYILEHSDSCLVLCDKAFLPLLKAAFEINGKALPVIEIVDAQAGQSASGDDTYDKMIECQPIDWRLPGSEDQAICLNYTSGTSGQPKGVVYHHRGAYLMAMGTVAAWALPQMPTYLSIVPMFHCNGWNHPWAMAVVGGNMVFTRDPLPAKLISAIKVHGVTHMGGAPIVLQMLCESPDAPENPFSPMIKVMTAGAPPPPSVLEKAAALGLEVMQVYGLTETYGHISQCLWKDEWADLSMAERASMQAMQGVSFPMVEDVRVVDRQTGNDVVADGKTQGEIAIRGNTVMTGYYKNEIATKDAFLDGWFWSGDAAVVHPDGYVQIRDRLKDVIISGGENISSVEVEAVLHRHPAVQLAAVVARPHAKWGESPCAFVELRVGSNPTEQEIIDFCRNNIAHFKAPKTVVFGELPKTATGKVQKYLLRGLARELGEQN
ncbi:MULTISPECIES: AMP-binding protein [unclassified Roseobacter]|jgi:fatty-acyl-CoA synthase|uniref:AMP-binding protein n=1 Tax=unclassified Roseobacter TaxID=196798 RepID=UPI0030EC167D